MPKAVAFVDYEHWYVSLSRNYGIRPNIKGWFEDLSKRVNLTEAFFFADFSHTSLSDEIGRIRPFSNKIIDTRSTSGVKKDFTDFIILDNIYQKALMSDDIDIFILFSGDGHFSSVTSFLKNIYSKEVGIYGISGSFSRQLQQTASWCVTLPTEQDAHGLEYKLIFDELKKNNIMYDKQALINTISSAHKNINQSNLKQTIDLLISEGTVSEHSVGRSKNVLPQLFVDWDKVAKSGIYDIS